MPGRYKGYRPPKNAKHVAGPKYRNTSKTACTRLLPTDLRGSGVPSKPDSVLGAISWKKEVPEGAIIRGTAPSFNKGPHQPVYTKEDAKHIGKKD